VKLPPRIAAFVALAIVLAALFIRLGVWQLDRLDERRAENERRRADIRRDTIVGTPDYANEFVLTRRSHNGSPGVHIVTPVLVSRPPYVDTTLVIRGWVYAADAATADLTRWREPRDRFSGYVMRRGAGQDTVFLVSRDSATATTPVRLPEPDFSEGPHFGYAIQWFSFAATALVGAFVVFRKAQGLPQGRQDNPAA
jgi:surfeit locus 1 family protein